MKKRLFLLFLTSLAFMLNAQVLKTIDVPIAGALSTLLTADEKVTITNLTVTGNIDATDVKCMRNEMPVLAVLDISGVYIKAYTGNGGTAASVNSYPANEMPESSFYNSFTSTGKISLKAVTLPASIVKIGGDCFQLCSGISNVVIPDGVTSIGSYAFAFCQNIGNVTIPNSVISILDGSFNYCDKLSSITIPNSITSIGSFAFSNCKGLKTIYSLNTIPPTLKNYCFTYVSSVTALYVPSSSVAAYKSAPGWSDSFLSVILANDVFVIKVNVGIGGSIKENNVTITDGSIISASPLTTKTFTFIPNAGYKIASATYNGLDVKNQIINNQYTTPTVNANATLSVTYQKNQYRLSLKDALTGTVNLLCDYGAAPSFDFTPSTGWKVNTVFFNNVDVTSSLVNGVYTVPTIMTDVLLNVSFISTATGSPELIDNRIKVYSTNSEIIVEGASEGETVNLYAVNGKLIQTVQSQGEQRLFLNVQRNAVYLVKTTNKTFKVIL